MVKKASKLKLILCVLCMMVLALDTETSLQATSEGIEICLYTVIPAIFPFMMLSIIINQSASNIHFKYLRRLSGFLQIPPGNENILIPSFLGGYPLGAYAIHYAWHNKRLPEDHAHRMMGFCNNAGPAFIFGMASGLFTTPLLPYLLWVIHIVSAIVTAKLIPSPHAVTLKNQCCDYQCDDRPMDKAIKSMASICGWVITIRIFLSFMDKLFLYALPQTPAIMITGLLELSNGAIELSKINNEGLRFVLFSGFLSFGGICVLLQTITATGTMGIGAYFPGKLAQCAISVLLSYVVQAGILGKEQRFCFSVNISILLTLMILIAIRLLVSKKIVAFSDNIMYNNHNNQ